MLLPSNVVVTTVNAYRMAVNAMLCFEILCEKRSTLHVLLVNILVKSRTLSYQLHKISVALVLLYTHLLVNGQITRENSPNEVSPELKAQSLRDSCVVKLDINLLGDL